MEKDILKKAFREWKKEAGADYALTSIDNLGDCSSCVNYALGKKYGIESKGIFLKWWTRGMNKDGSVDDFERYENCALVAHDLTDEQAAKFYEVMSRYYNVAPEVYDPSKCFRLFEKDAPVYKVAYKYEWDGNEYENDDYFFRLLDATDMLNMLFNQGRVATMTRIY